MQDFLRALRESGVVVVSVEPPPECVDEVEVLLREHDSLYRAELSPGAPDLIVETAYWAARKLYQTCQLLTLRDAPAALARETLLDVYEGPHGPEVDYSVDLALAYLPSLYRLAERVAPGDPVLDVTRRLAADWPLSSVGIPGIECPQRLTFWDNSCLRGLYIDKVIESRDLVRLEDPRVAGAVRDALGAYPELAPKIMETLNAS